MKKSRTVVCLFVIAVALTSNSAGQNSPTRPSSEISKRFVGMWRLVSILDAKGQPSRGDHPTGFIVYDASGSMSVQIMPDRPRSRYAGGQPTPDEAKAALSGYTAYFGPWTVDERAQTVTHHIKGSLNPGQLGVDNVRKFEFSGDRLTLTVLPITQSSTRLTWERVK